MQVLSTREVTNVTEKLMCILLDCHMHDWPVATVLDSRALVFSFPWLSSLL